MKRIYLYTFSIITVLATACTPSGWDQDTKSLFLEACVSTLPNQSAYTIDQVKAYCDCALEEVIKVYPNQQDAIANGVKLHDLEGAKACKETILK